MEYPYPPPLPIVSKTLVIHLALIAVTLACLTLFIRLPQANWPVYVFAVSLVASWLVSDKQLFPHPEGVSTIAVWLLLNSLLCVIGLVVAYFRGVGLSVGSVVVLMFMALAFTLVLPALNQSKKAAKRLQCLNNLHNIVIALHNYASVNDGALPSAGFTPADLSWRVEVLPQLDNASLYRAYQRDKPWHDPANDEFAKMWLPIYACPSNPIQKNAQGMGLTSFAALTGPGTALEQENSPTLDDIGMAGGLSQTILIVEACGANIVWNEPRDIDVSREKPGINLPGKTRGASDGWMSTCHKHGVNVVFADGSAKSLSLDTDPQVLKALSTVDASDNPPEKL